MGNYDSCRLMHINLKYFVKLPYTKHAVFDVDAFKHVVYLALMLNDDLVTLEAEAIDRIISKVKQGIEKDPDSTTEVELWEKIKRNTLRGRRCGLGITGLADVIAALGFKYGDKASLYIVEQIMKAKLSAELDCEVDMAIIRGAFEDYDADLEFIFKGDCFVDRGANKFYQMLWSEYPDKVLRMIAYGRRNISWSTCAPTGSVSILTDTSSGIEPLFRPFYIRSKKCLDDNDRVDYIDKDGEKFTNYTVVHKGLKEWWAANKHLYADIEDHNIEAIFNISPYYKCCAHDIDYIDRIKMQAIIQKYTTHSISSTINLPENTTIETVSNIYIEAWKHNLKGVTIYREGSRMGILKNVDNKDSRGSKFVQHHAPRRPAVLPAKSFKIKVKGTTYAVIVGLYEGKPYEVFATECSKEDFIVQSGTITKVKKQQYEFRGDKDGKVWENLQLCSNKEEERACTLLASMLLRQGAPVKYIIKTIRKVSNVVSSFSTALARVLGKFDEESNEKTDDCCPECGAKLIHEAGCVKCTNCSYSLCMMCITHT